VITYPIRPDILNGPDESDEVTSSPNSGNAPKLFFQKLFTTRTTNHPNGLALPEKEFYRLCQQSTFKEVVSVTLP